MAALDASWLEMPWNILKVAIGLGLVIFVHELGHFVVAKLCGVKCEKFYLGFDIAGWKLAKFRWGETEYGIGILPLGGYVKMLGQEDNPARLREELEKAKAAKEAAAEPPATQGAPQGSAAEATPSATELALAEQALYDPRSYLAKSVPQRMAIISAGVIMNVIFAFLFAMGAYRFGVEQPSPIAGGITPGEGAWQANVQVGDRILEIGQTPIQTYVDLKMAVSLGSHEQGVAIVLQRPGMAEPLRVMAKTQKTGLTPTVGIGLPWTTTLRSDAKRLHTAAAAAQPPLKAGDRIVAVNDTPVASYAELHRYLAAHPEETLRLQVERPAKGDHGAAAKPEELSVTVPPEPMQTVGLVLEMGPITAVQNGSPAAEAGLEPGDVLQQLNGQPVGDPMTLPDRLRKLAQQEKSVRLGIARPKQTEPREVEVSLRPVTSYDTLVNPNSPLTAPALGMAYQVKPQVAAVLPGSPAAEAGIQPGTKLQETRLRLPDAAWLKQHKLTELAEQIPTDWLPAEQAWPFLMDSLQMGFQELKLEVRTASGTQTLTPVPASDWFTPERGFAFEVETFPRQAASLAEAIPLGRDETWSALTATVRIVQRLLDRQVSPRALSGPVGIAQLAYQSAAHGMGELLLFLTLLSANLAVLNFLPIPVLDGGHMVFLAYEGITGKAPNERVQLALSYLGLLLLLTLMVWALGLDLGLIARK